MMSINVCMGVYIADYLEAFSVKQFMKHIMELYANNQQGFSKEFDVSMKLFK